jgi:hypothetical protein
VGLGIAWLAPNSQRIARYSPSRDAPIHLPAPAIAAVAGILLATAMVILKKIFWLDPSGVSHFYLPLALLLPLVLLGHWLGVLASTQAQATANPPCVPAPRWAARIWERARACFAVRPHPAAGLYVLLPVPGFIGGFVLATWVLLIGLFAAINSTPFIYFQF